LILLLIDAFQSFEVAPIVDVVVVVADKSIADPQQVVVRVERKVRRRTNFERRIYASG
jgi:hypothetical protein